MRQRGETIRVKAPAWVGRTVMWSLALTVLSLSAAGLQTPPAALDRPGLSSTFDQQRRLMVDRQIRQRGVRDARILEAMSTVPRHLFVPPDRRSEAYADHPLPIGFGQTISQPYVVARMCSLLDLQPDDRVLEIGTGSAYHAAVLSRLVREVYTVEIVEPLAERARGVLERLGYDNVRIRVGDGYRGWAEEAPFDAIVLTAEPPEIPQPLLDQLAMGGRLVAPVAGRLVTVTRTERGLLTEKGDPVRFVPMTGEAQAGQRPAEVDASSAPPGLPN